MHTRWCEDMIMIEGSGVVHICRAGGGRRGGTMNTSSRIVRRRIVRSTRQRRIRRRIRRRRGHVWVLAVMGIRRRIDRL